MTSQNRYILKNIFHVILLTTFLRMTKIYTSPNNLLIQNSIILLYAPIYRIYIPKNDIPRILVVPIHIFDGSTIIHSEYTDIE
jgi:hypothetical protein